MKENPLQDLIQTPAQALILAIVATISGGLREEIQRAFILHRFEQYLGGAHVGLILYSLVFGLGHSLQGWDAVLTTAMLGAFWGCDLHRAPQHRRAGGEPLAGSMRRRYSCFLQVESKK